MTIPEDPHWGELLQNYGHALAQLREAMDIRDVRSLTQLEVEGTIRRFKVTSNLACKLLQAYLEASGVALEKTEPVAVIHAALLAQIINQDDVWMQMFDAQNKLSGAYDFEIFKKIIEDQQKFYFGCLEGLYVNLVKQAKAEGSLSAIIPPSGVKA